MCVEWSAWCKRLLLKQTIRTKYWADCSNFNHINMINSIPRKLIGIDFRQHTSPPSQLDSMGSLAIWHTLKMFHIISSNKFNRINSIMILKFWLIEIESNRIVVELIKIPIWKFIFWIIVSKLKEVLFVLIIISIGFCYNQIECDK